SLAKLTNVGTLFAFAIVCLTVLYLRYKHPNMERPFKTPLSPFTPILGALMCLFLLMSLIAHKQTREFFLIYLAIGLVVYFLYGVRKSKLGQGIIITGPEENLDVPKH